MSAAFVRHICSEIDFWLIGITFEPRAVYTFTQKCHCHIENVILFLSDDICKLNSPQMTSVELI